MIDLQPFCAVENFRAWLNAPFSIGDFSYATNGHILVRVARRAGIGDLTATADVSRVLHGIEDEAMWPLGDLVFPAPPSANGSCRNCEGCGYDTDGLDCASCDGYGDFNIEARTSTTLRGAIYALNYVRLLAGLPDVEIAKEPPRETQLFFKFDGGVGALMPMRGQHRLHVEVEPQ